ncbi:MAG: hypothetical protein LC101_01490 [Flavobacteriales bacterium]|nr:hypothetical protein [Flavobacteriales bacterium]MCZ2442441.1 hypothetical protein [Flavobacteriales bacterium]
MHYIRPYFIANIFLLLSLQITFAETLDSTITQTEKAGSFLAGDTLVNLNKLNGGIVKFQISDEAKQTLYENGLLFTENAVLLLQEPSKLQSSVFIEVKTFASDREWYINNIRIDHNKNSAIIYVVTDKIEMATFWRKDGKIWVVIAVVAILFSIVIGYLFYLDRQINRLS